MFMVMVYVPGFDKPFAGRFKSQEQANAVFESMVAVPYDKALELTDDYGGQVFVFRRDVKVITKCDVAQEFQADVDRQIIQAIEQHKGNAKAESHPELIKAQVQERATATQRTPIRGANDTIGPATVDRVQPPTRDHP